MASVTINTGPDARTTASSLPRELWPSLLKWRRIMAKLQIPKDCRTLVFFLEDAKSTGDWLGCGSQEAYLRDGLGLNPEIVRWAMLGLEMVEDPSKPQCLEDMEKLGKSRQETAMMLAGPEGPAPKGKHGGARMRVETPKLFQKDEEQDVNNTLKDGKQKQSEGTTNSRTIIARLKRDYPDIAERLARGEIKSARAAGREAGIVKDPTKLELLWQAWRRASDEDRAAFLAEVMG